MNALHELDRNIQLSAQYETDALLARISQHDGCGCAECEDVPATTPRQWVSYIALSLVLTLGAWLLGMAVVS